VKPCPPADGRAAAGPIEARALAFLPPGMGEELGLGLEGGLSEAILCVCGLRQILYMRGRGRKKREAVSFS